MDFLHYQSIKINIALKVVWHICKTLGGGVGVLEKK